MNSWAIKLNKEYFKFSCAHFLIFPDGSKERLHGHNYQVTVEIEGDLTEQGLVIDFLDAKPVVRDLCDSLDEHWLVPSQHPELTVEELDDGHSRIVYRDCRYVVPTAEVLLLPINNTSVENLATWFGETLHARLVDDFGVTQVRRLTVAISETSGQSGIHEYRDDDRR
ncbi:MAG: 6-pyruvoyl tetrahydropterin synthase family protein [Candidatus Binatia bacterium]|nr:6-pyruvoyl tetrahydropterin synthase family protein [Candidatus Binatia bacterium]